MWPSKSGTTASAPAKRPRRPGFRRFSVSAVTQLFKGWGCRPPSVVKRQWAHADSEEVKTLALFVLTCVAVACGQTPSAVTRTVTETVAPATSAPKPPPVPVQPTVGVPVHESTGHRFRKGTHPLGRCRS